MDELDILRRAKTYVDKLANGIDPLTDNAVGESDVVNQVRISRCLFYVSGVLQKVIDNGGVVCAPVAPVSGHPKKTPFEIPSEALSSFAFYSQPVSVSEIVRQLNDLSHREDMKQLTYNRIAEWLLAEGVFYEINLPTGRKTKIPTEKGHKLGMNLEKRTGKQGDYNVVLLNGNAQRFLIDHMPQILAFEAPSSSKEMNETDKPGDRVRSGNDVLSKPWTREEDVFLRDLVAHGASMGDMILSLHRESNDITARVKALMLTCKREKEDAPC